jgi:ABC-type Fe3+-hydroxamate transport system substrate-binding protein
MLGNGTCPYSAVSLIYVGLTLAGTKNPKIKQIIELQPDIVIANQEENLKKHVERLEAAGIYVWVTYPRTVEEGVREYEQMVGLAKEAARPHALEVIQPVTDAFHSAQAALEVRQEKNIPGTRYFCPIWKDPYMAVGGDTYAHDLFRLCGGTNVFEDFGTGDKRYPKVTEQDIIDAAPEVILLPDEPYVFGDVDREEIMRLPVPAAESGRVHIIDGSWATWYGPRIAPAIAAFRPLLKAGE